MKFSHVPIQKHFSFYSLFRYFLLTYTKYSVIVILEIKILETNFLLPKTISDACFYALLIHVKINSALQFYLTIWILVIFKHKSHVLRLEWVRVVETFFCRNLAYNQSSKINFLEGNLV